jgi:hypothetical protein
MFNRFNRIVAIVAVLFFFGSAWAMQQPARPKRPQTPRQALIEMIRGGGATVRRHLTEEVQEMINEAAKKKDAPDQANAMMLKMYTELTSIPSLGGEKDLQTFDSGPVLLSFVQSYDKTKIEVHVDGDDLSGDLDTLQLSIHIFKDGQEQTIPFMPTIIVGLKQQEHIWRLNELGGNARLIVGEPRFFMDMLKFRQSEEQDVQPKKAKEEASEKPERPKVPAPSIVSMLSYAESGYASSNPEAGFTCNLADLVNQGAGFSEMLDPQVSTGAYNGYRFSIVGCDGQPASGFHIIAEPLTITSGSQAFCTDPTHNIRVSDDGRGGTCLTAGRAFRFGVDSHNDEQK